jgi:hypothetical protein
MLPPCVFGELLSYKIPDKFGVIQKRVLPKPPIPWKYGNHNENYHVFRKLVVHQEQSVNHKQEEGRNEMNRQTDPSFPKEDKCRLIWDFWLENLCFYCGWCFLQVA